MKLLEIAQKQIKKKQDIRLQPYMYQTKEEIQQWMKDNHIEGFVNRELEIEPSTSSVHLGLYGSSNHFIDVNGEQRLPVQFKLAPNFDGGYQQTNSLIGYPYVVLGDCRIYNANLKTLEGCPRLVSGILEIRLADAHLQNFNGFAEHCKQLRLYNVSDHPSIIESIEGISDEIEELEIGCSYTNIAELYKYCKRLKHLWIITSPEKEANKNKKYNFLQIFKFKNIESFSIGLQTGSSSNDVKASQIINKHLQNDKDMLECQEELITNGLSLYARV